MRFPYKGDWHKRKLNEICLFFKGNGLSKSDLSNEGFPCILYGELYTTYKNEVISDIASKTTTTLLNPFLSKNNDLIIPGSGEDPIDIAVARAIYQNDIILGGDLNVLRPKSNVSAAFLSYQLNGVRRYDIAKKAQGKSIVHLHNSDLKEVYVSIPTYDEQLHIVKLLTKIDEMIETQSKIISDYTFLLNLLRDKLLYDKNHKKIKLSTLISIYNGYAFKSNNYKANAKYKIITIGNVTGDRYINLDSINTIDKLPSDIQQHQIIKNGSILVSLTGNVGRTSICNEDDCLLNQRVALVKSKNINEKFIYHILSSSRFLNKMISSSQGAAQKNISTKDILNYEITLLSKERMEYVTLLLEKIENKINYEKNILEHLYTQKQYLLKNMFI